MTKIDQFLDAFGRRGNAPKLDGWSYARDEFVKNVPFDTVVVVYYRDGEEYVARAQAEYREGFYYGVISLSNGIYDFKEYQSVSSVDFETFYRNFQRALKGVTLFIEGNVPADPEINFAYYSFMHMFGEDGDFVPNPGWEQDEGVETEGVPDLSAFFVLDKGEGNHAYLLASTDFETFEVSLEVYRDFSSYRTEKKEFLENIYILEAAIYDFMDLAEADFSFVEDSDA